MVTKSHDFLNLVVDAMAEHLAVIDRHGEIEFVNRAWVAFGKENHCRVAPDWRGVNYLEACDASARMGDDFGKQASEGLNKMIRQDLASFYMEYPCHSPDEKRWFIMRVMPFEQEGAPHFVISHQNITERKRVEEQVLLLSQVDELTKVPNRRYFDQFFAAEWKRCARLGLPASMAMMDIDCFKQLNDHYGHQAGDACLVKVGAVLNNTGKRPGDLFARYGGEEFALIFGNTTSQQASVVLGRIGEAIEEMAIPNEKSPVKPMVTVSFGLAMLHPDQQCHEADLIEAADKRLYAAKEQGRNRIVSDCDCGNAIKFCRDVHEFVGGFCERSYTLY